MALVQHIFRTELGWMGLVLSVNGLVRVTQPNIAHDEVKKELFLAYGVLAEDATAFGELPDQLRRHLKGEVVCLKWSLDMSMATPFQLTVWKVLLQIPHGEVRSYGWVAQAIGQPGAARAVGQAVGANPLAILVPCHRVIGADGTLTGYAGGLEVKRKLLDIEGYASSSLKPIRSVEDVAR